VSADVAVRRAEAEPELEAWRSVRLAVVPNERCPSAQELLRTASPEKLFLLAELDGQVVGCGVADRSGLAGVGMVAPRVLPEARRRGVGTALLLALAGHVEGLGFTAARATVEDEGSLAFAYRFGFREVGREVEQVRVVGEREPHAKPIPGLELVSLADRPDLAARTYHELAAEALRDIPVESPLEISAEDWEREWLAWPEGTFIALADGEIVGYAGVERDEDVPRRAGHSVTVVRRDWRRRGVASALKQETIAWASVSGVRELYTWTQDVNAGMRRVNERLGYVPRGLGIFLRAELPLSR
jgi:GNAT superfamily N-acetyltransferase